MDRRSKNHHFVPRVLQRQFAYEGERIWYATRGKDGYSAPELRNMNSTFRSRDLYTVLIDGQYSDLVEREFYGRVDNYLGYIIPRILNDFKLGLIPNFEGDALEELRQCILTMIRRTPDAFPEIYASSEDVGRQFIEKLVTAYRAEGMNAHAIESLKRELEEPSKLRARGRDVRVRASLRPMNAANALLREFKVKWAICEGKSSFILPGIISFRVGNGESTHLASPNVEIWMPISPKLAMVLVRDELNKLPAASIVTQLNVRRINEYAATLSTSIASHSKKLLESLTGRKAEN